MHPATTSPMNHFVRAALGVALLLIAAPLGAQQESTTPAPQVGPSADTTAVHSDRPRIDSSRTADAPRAVRATAAVSGTVRDSVAGTAVAGARVELLGTRYYAYVRPDGTF